MQRYFEAMPASVGLARDFAVRALGPAEPSGMVQDIRLCVSELATNALGRGAALGHGFVVAVVPEGESVRLEVHDTLPGLPEKGRPAATDVSGRGLVLVDALAESWGVAESDSGGKSVWARFAAAPAPGPPGTPVGA